ncbi:MAG: nuclear transport factor 2 family protein [Myxococcales bacterium]
MANNTTEHELLDLERKYWEALKNRDYQTAMSLSDEPTTVAGADGVGVLDRKTMGEMMRTGPYSLTDYEMKDVHVRLLRDDVGIVTYRVHEKLIVDGKPLTLDATDSSTWVRRDGRWVCSLHTESIAGDPFGRDRQPVH